MGQTEAVGESLLLNQWDLGMTKHMATLTGREVFALFFKKKKCKKCGKKLARTTEKEDKGYGWHEGVSDGSFFYGQKYDYYFVYKCDDCKELYTLEHF